MESFILYYLKVNLALALLYIGYRLLFQRDTFFKMRRATLLAIYLIAFLYQLPDISGWLSSQVNVTEVVTYFSSILSKETAIKEGIETDAQTTSENWKKAGEAGMQIIYLSGVIILLVRCTIEWGMVVYTRLKSKRIRIHGYDVYQLPKPEEPYSFFNWIFIYPGLHTQESLEEIMLHETAHVRQMHSFDVILGEFVAIFCWINPFAWLLKEEISINHEYLADNEVIKAGYNKKEYQYHLIGMEHPNKAAAKLYNNFSVLPLKKRISMLNKKRTNNVRRVKYLALIPMAAGLLLLNNIDAMARVVTGQNSASLIPAPVETPVTEVTGAEVAADTALPQDPEEEDIVFLVVETPPQYPGGNQALVDFLKKETEKQYPASEKEKGIQGRVTLTFIIEKDGSLSNIEVAKTEAPSLNEAAIAVLKKMDKWTPGKQRDRIVRVKYMLPVQFKLN